MPILIMQCEYALIENYLSISLQETFNYIFTSYSSGQEQYSPSESPSVSKLEEVSETKLVCLQGDTRMTDLFHYSRNFCRN